MPQSLIHQSTHEYTDSLLCCSSSSVLRWYLCVQACFTKTEIDWFVTFLWHMFSTWKQTDKQINTSDFIASLADIISHVTRRLWDLNTGSNSAGFMLTSWLLRRLHLTALHAHGGSHHYGRLLLLWLRCSPMVAVFGLAVAQSGISQQPSVVAPCLSPGCMPAHSVCGRKPDIFCHMLSGCVHSNMYKPTHL